MATTKSRVAVGLTTAALITGGLAYLQPPSHDMQQRARQQQEQRLTELSDANDAERDRYRDAGNDLGNAENQRRLTPGEHRPPEPRVRIRLP